MSKGEKQRQDDISNYGLASMLFGGIAGMTFSAVCLSAWNFVAVLFGALGMISAISMIFVYRHKLVFFDYEDIQGVVEDDYSEHFQSDTCSQCKNEEDRIK